MNIVFRKIFVLIGHIFILPFLMFLVCPVDHCHTVETSVVNNLICNKPKVIPKHGLLTYWKTLLSKLLSLYDVSVNSKG